MSDPAHTLQSGKLLPFVAQPLAVSCLGGGNGGTPGPSCPGVPRSNKVGDQRYSFTQGGKLSKRKGMHSESGRFDSRNGWIIL